MAPCNHVACSNCWDSWLKRSLTCPNCRKPIDKEKLTMVVFHKEAECLPSLTQMCASDDSDLDEDGELEIVGK